MKFMKVWSITPENMEAAGKRFGEGIEPPEGIKVLGAWHEVSTGKGVTLLETDDPVALTRESLQWSDLIDMKVVPVVDAEEIGKALS